jgi:hypothetical protein
MVKVIGIHVHSIAKKLYILTCIGNAMNQGEGYGARMKGNLLRSERAMERKRR